VGGPHLRVDEERTAAPSVFVARGNEHRLALTEREHESARVAQGWRPLESRGGLLELGIFEAGRRRPVQAKFDPRHDEASGGNGLEEAVSVAKLTLVAREGTLPARSDLGHFDTVDGLRNLLAVGADVLDGS